MLKDKKCYFNLNINIFLALLIIVVMFSFTFTVDATQKINEKIVRFDEVWPPRLDPALGQDFSSSIIYANVYDSLVFPEPNGTVHPHLAESWGISSDGLMYKFKLRQGVKFHNGNELTADDVVFSLKRLMTMGEGYAYLFTPIIEDIKAEGKYQVIFKLKNSFGPFLNALVNLYIINKQEIIAHIKKPGNYGENGDYGREWLLTNDAGSGPYKVKEMKLAEHLIAEKFDDYWLGFEENNPDSFVLIGTEEPVTIRTLMARREFEITDQWQSEENYKAMAQIEGVDIAKFPSGSLLAIQLHNKKAPTDDIHIRRALAYAMDYNMLINGVFPGATQPKGPVSSILLGHKKDIFQYNTNIEKAKEELKKSKYFGKLDQFPIDVCYAAEWTTADKIALLFKACAAKIGIKVNIAKQPWAKMIADVTMPETTAQANILTVAPHYSEAGSPLSRYHSHSCGTWEQTEWLQSSEIDEMITDALSTVDMTERIEKYYNLQEKLVELCPSIWLVDVLEKHAYQSAYLEWGTAQRVKIGGNSIPVQGYNLYMRDIKVFPERIPEK